ncbi:MAG: tRNA (adenosine(37)-N6)-threonylcarbamoyltransferase complex dimerization subunit type 1 TsaB [Bryobacteraceae bacterium]
MSELILAVDTTHEFGSIALLGPEHLTEEVALHSPEGFSRILHLRIGALLERHSVAIEHIHCFASASGPGSFTGVRIGLACVKGLAEALGRPVVAVPNLEVVASYGSRPLRAAVLDARRGEVYAALYDERLRPVQAPVTAKLDEWIASLPEGDIEFLSPDIAPLRSLNVPATQVPRALAGAIARIGLQRFRAGAAIDPAFVDADYVRRSDAELMWKEPTGPTPS